MEKQKSLYQVGQVVQVKTNLRVGATYYNNDGMVSSVFTSHMSKYRGDEAVVEEVLDSGRYILDLDEDYTFTDDMLQLPVDTLAKADYKHNHEVESLLFHTSKLYEKDKMEREINDALDKKDEKLFIELTNKYYGKS